MENNLSFINMSSNLSETNILKITSINHFKFALSKILNFLFDNILVLLIVIISCLFLSIIWAIAHKHYTDSN